MNATPHRKRVAVVGSGIAGLSCAWLLRGQHAVTLYEAQPRPGGHADTQIVSVEGSEVAVDTGFIVYNNRNYPNLTSLFGELGVVTKASEMSFGVSIGNGALEYAGGGLGRVFAQRSNTTRPRFWGMVRDILRFYREAPALLDDTSGMSLGEYLDRNRYGAAFVQDHILPMGAAIWSGSVNGMRGFPARHFVRFFQNHGLLSLSDRPEWRTVDGGSHRYVARVVADLKDVRLASPVLGVRRNGVGVDLREHDGTVARFDAVVLACHADEALALIDAPTAAESALLGAIRCQDNEAVLHTDTRLMPHRPGVWSAWNYVSDGPGDHARQVCVTYWMNRLQRVQTPRPLFVSLNPLRPPDPALVLRVRHYRHPQFDPAAMAAQARLDDIQGKAGLYFAGAWAGWGFHEDGITAAIRVAMLLGVDAPWGAATRRPGVG
jgi:uncharacterized protein